MICEPCRAGQQTVKVTRQNHDGSKTVQTTKGHNACQGGTWCDCQHKKDVDIRLPLPAEDC